MVSADSGEFEGFEWDQWKSDATLAARGFDFDAAGEVFEGPYLEREDRRRESGERRWVATGETRAGVITVVWTPRGRVRRIITAWRASRRERREYRDYRQAHE